MLIKLTNAINQFEDTPILVNTDFIMSVYPKTTIASDTVTVLWSNISTSWEVKETVEEVWNLINQSDA